MDIGNITNIREDNRNLISFTDIPPLELSSSHMSDSDGFEIDLKSSSEIDLKIDEKNNDESKIKIAEEELECSDDWWNKVISQTKIRRMYKDKINKTLSTKNEVIQREDHSTKSEESYDNLRQEYCLYEETNFRHLEKLFESESTFIDKNKKLMKRSPRLNSYAQRFSSTKLKDPKHHNYSNKTNSRAIHDLESEFRILKCNDKYEEFRVDGPIIPKHSEKMTQRSISSILNEINRMKEDELQSSFNDYLRKKKHAHSLTMPSSDRNENNSYHQRFASKSASARCELEGHPRTQSLVTSYYPSIQEITKIPTLKDPSRSLGPDFSSESYTEQLQKRNRLKKYAENIRFHNQLKSQTIQNNHAVNEIQSRDRSTSPHPRIKAAFKPGLEEEVLIRMKIRRSKMMSYAKSLKVKHKKLLNKVVTPKEYETFKHDSINHVSQNNSLRASETLNKGLRMEFYEVVPNRTYNNQNQTINLNPVDEHLQNLLNRHRKDREITLNLLSHSSLRSFPAKNVIQTSLT